MATMAVFDVLGQSGISEIINYEVVRGNAFWRLGAVLIVLILTLAIGRIVQYVIEGVAKRREERGAVSAITLIMKSLSKPIYVGIFAVGIYICKLFLYFDDEMGIGVSVGDAWVNIAKVVGAVAVAYALYRLVDVAEFYLNKVVSKTETKLDDMLVPVIRKSLRITVTIVSILYIAESVVGANVKSLLLSAGVGGIAVALAAKDTIANFFGSITIFADRPFQIDELVKIDGHYGPVEEVGFRSTRVRTLNGSLVTIPNNTIANSIVENVGKRPFIRRTSNITITYDSGPGKAAKAVEIIKDILAGVAEVNKIENNVPRVYFDEFNDWSLNIYMTYWVKPADFWISKEVGERVNLEIMKRFEAEGIEFAFPSQTVYLKKE